MAKENTIGMGSKVVYKGQSAKVVGKAFPRWGDTRCVIQRDNDKRRFTVAVRYLVLADANELT